VATKIDPVTPEARSGHAAIWTGREMIVWGGARASPSLSSIPEAATTW